MITGEEEVAEINHGSGFASPIISLDYGFREGIVSFVADAHIYVTSCRKEM
jgi:hypothetical protein